MDRDFLDAFAFTQASLMAQATMIEALVMSHPDPAKLRDAWDRLVAPRMTDTLQDVVSRPAERAADRYLIERFQSWTEKLGKHSGNPGPHPR